MHILNLVSGKNVTTENYLNVVEEIVKANTGGQDMQFVCIPSTDIDITLQEASRMAQVYTCTDFYVNEEGILDCMISMKSIAPTSVKAGINLTFPKIPA